MLIVLSTPTTFDKEQSKTIAFNLNSVLCIGIRETENGFIISLDFKNQWYGLCTYQTEENAIIEANNIISAFESGDKVYRIEAKTIEETLKDTENNEIT